MGFFRGWAGRAFVILAMLSAMSAATAQTGVRMIEGSLTFRERIALPPDALVLVEARDERGRLLGEATLLTRGRQVPLPFALGVPADGEARLRAAIVLDGEPAWFAADIPVAAGSEPLDMGEIMLRRYEAMFAPVSLRCGERDIRVGYYDRNAVLVVDGRRIGLSQVPAASGALYEAPDDPATRVWNRGNRVLVSIAGEEYPECSVVPPETPKPYVARGNEPGWTLTVEDGRYTLVTDYGARTVEGQLPEAAYVDGAFRFEATETGLEFRISEGPCRDDMTGMPYPDRVEVRLDGQSFRGCGGDTLDLLLGDAWTVTAVDGEAVPEGAALTMTFTDDGRLGGAAPCNRYATSFGIGGELVSVGPIAATRMLCPDEVMARESRFFAALAAVGRIDFDDDGTLVMFDPAIGTPAIEARR